VLSCAKKQANDKKNPFDRKRIATTNNLANKKKSRRQHVT
jgi:hypothetical protein